MDERMGHTGNASRGLEQPRVRPDEPTSNASVMRGNSDSSRKDSEQSSITSPRHHSSAQLLPNVTLPKGGGAIRDIGEKFSVNAATGTGSPVLPLPFRHGWNTPQLQLAYDSDSGNGPFGFGWSLDLPATTRKADKGTPRYCRGKECHCVKSDVYILAGVEDLVPVLNESGAIYQITFYRLRVEGLFSRIERWIVLDTDITHWCTTSRDDVTVLYGLGPQSRIYVPNDARKIFSWRISWRWDTDGNLAQYDCLAEESVDIGVSAMHEVNRNQTYSLSALRRECRTIRLSKDADIRGNWLGSQKFKRDKTPSAGRMFMFPTRDTTISSEMDPSPKYINR